MRDIVRELRETIYQLRANVSEDDDIVRSRPATSSASPSAPASRRSGCPSAATPLPYRIEQELWRIGQEALVNVERHAGAHRGRRCAGTSTTASPGSK